MQTSTLPNNTIVNTVYDEHGLTIANFGSLTYTRHYTYNIYDEMVNLRTWQQDPNGNFSDLSGAALTTWSYDEATGILLSKRDHENEGCDYQYDTAGRLTQRTWARGVGTNYAYTIWGELDTVNYSGDLTGTRPLDYDYDRIGRPLLVTQTGTTSTPGTNTHSFTYNGGSTGNLLIDAETLNYGNSGITRTMDHSQDTFLRPLTHDLKNGSTSEHLVDMGYSITDGRLSTITDNTASNNGGAKTFSYNYQAANYSLIQSCTTPVSRTTQPSEPYEPK